MIVKRSDRAIRVRALYPTEARYFRAVGLYWGDEIAVDADLAPADQAETLIHECIHAIWHDRKMGKRVTEESAASHLGAGLAQLIRENPKLMTALSNALHDGKPIIRVNKKSA